MLFVSHVRRTIDRNNLRGKADLEDVSSHGFLETRGITKNGRC